MTVAAPGPGAAPPAPARWSVYVHFPYCAKRCAYCDFATAAVREIPRERYTQAVLQELALRTATLRPAPIDTVFFGGGTPSLWGAVHIGAVLHWLDGWGGIARDAEVTLEANPGVLEAGDLDGYAAAGINRVSVGIQALDADRLRWLDRVHDVAAAHTTLADLARLLANGRLHSASADLMFGVPGQTTADLARDVAAVLGAGVPHLSAYALTVEPGTPLHVKVERGLTARPDDDAQAEQLDALPDLVAPWGLQRYEVSNFARPGQEGRHNLAYWRGNFWLAVGMGAHGFVPGALHAMDLAGTRYGNVRDHTAWLDALAQGRLAEAMREDIDLATHLTERVMTGLRLREGVDLEALAVRVGPAAVAALRGRVALARARRVPIELDGHTLRVAPDAMRMLDAVVRAVA